MSQTGFAIDIYQNEYLPAGGQDVNAIVTVTAQDTVPAAPAESTEGGSSAEVIIVDCSGSMAYPSTKISQVRLATCAAIDVIHDGVAFSVLAGNDGAWPVYPEDGRLVIADEKTKQQAKQAVGHLHAAGGTAIGQWLRLARTVFSTYPAELRHAILLTDGKNEHEPRYDLEAAINACEGVFICDCRGVGTDWVVEELRRVSSGLLGSVDIVPEPSGLAEDFAAMMESSMGKEVADVSLRVWTPQHASVRFVKQVAPAVADLTSRPAQSGSQESLYPTGAWGPGESRDYHLCVRVASAAVGQEMLAARVSLIAGPQAHPEVLAQGLVRAVWTDDEALSTQINGHVAHYTGQAELAEVIQEGLEARKRGDEETATAKLGRAVALAEKSGNAGTAKLLAKVVDVVDAATGTVRLKNKVDDADEMALDTRSTRTVRTRK